MGRPGEKTVETRLVQIITKIVQPWIAHIGTLSDSIIASFDALIYGSLAVAIEIAYESIAEIVDSGLVVWDDLLRVDPSPVRRLLNPVGL
jgi:hypothetical protein